MIDKIKAIIKKFIPYRVLFYVLIAVLIIVFAETVGLWFVNNKLIIPEVRMNAVKGSRFCLYV